MRKNMTLKRNKCPGGKFLILVAIFCSSLFYLSAAAEDGISSKLQEARTYSGHVTDDEGFALPGVYVMLQGKNEGTVTDAQGDFSITAREGEALVFSFIGYLDEVVTLTQETKINVKMIQDITALDEVVVIGYGVTTKKDLTGAVASLSADKLNQGPVTNPLQQMAGRAAGVNITQTGSEPGSNPSIRIRGITSLIGGNDPLIVVDGIQGNMDLLNQVPPSEIETIDVLKDASATAIYGSRGAPGVVIVTTKKSKDSKPTVGYDGSFSIDVIANELEMMNAEEWRAEARNWNIGYSADHGSDTDWYDLLTQRGMTQNHTLSFGGGTGNFNYRASVSAIMQKGVVINSRNDNYIAHVQATQKALNDKLSITINLHNSIRKNVGSPSNVGRAAFTSNLISNAYVSKPTDPVLFSDGSYYSDPEVFEYINPYAVANTVVNEGEIQNQFAGLKAEFEIVKGLTLGWFGNWRKVNNNEGYFAPVRSTLRSAIENRGLANARTRITDEKLMDISLAWDKTFYKHKISAVAVYELQSQLYQGHFVQAKGFINDITTYNALQLGSLSLVKSEDFSSYKDDRKLESVLGRVNYSYDEKYLITLSMRYDGSSVFGDNYKWGSFPSASIAWRLTEEPFLKNQSLLSNLKLRAGYGITGNQQGLRPQQSYQLVNSSGNVFFNGGLITNFIVIQNGNKDLRWETRYQTNVGLDFGLHKGKLNGSVEVYSATTKNLLFNYTVPTPPYPYGTIAANVGSLKNEGIEFTLDYLALKTSDWTISLGGNFSLLRNEVLELSGKVGGNEVNTDYVSWGYNSYLIKGKPIGTFYILENSGKDPVTNEETVVDRDNNDVIDQIDRSPDRHFAGSALPTYTYAFTPTVKYKNIDLSMVWRGAGGNKIYNKINRDFSLFENLGKSNLLKSASDLGLFTSKYSSDLWLEDGDFLRFENLTIGYTFNTQKLKYVRSMRMSLTGSNLLLFTKYTGLDPELNVSGGNGSGYDAGIYPRTRNYAVALQITF
jgi:iron complex outermembrane receptor protein